MGDLRLLLQIRRLLPQRRARLLRPRRLRLRRPQPLLQPEDLLVESGPRSRSGAQAFVLDYAGGRRVSVEVGAAEPAAQRPNAASLPTRPAIAGSTLRMPLGLDRGWRFSEARAATCDQGKGGLSAFFFRGCAHCLWFFGCMEPCIQIQTVTKLSIPATTMTNAAVRLLLQLMVSLSQY